MNSADAIFLKFFESNQLNFSEKEPEQVEDLQVKKVLNKRKIPLYFTCEKVIGTDCRYKTRMEAAFREHILTHVAEKLKDQLMT